MVAVYIFSLEPARKYEIRRLFDWASSVAASVMLLPVRLGWRDTLLAEIECSTVARHAWQWKGSSEVSSVDFPFASK